MADERMASHRTAVPTRSTGVDVGCGEHAAAAGAEVGTPTEAGPSSEVRTATTAEVRTTTTAEVRTTTTAVTAPAAVLCKRRRSERQQAGGHDAEGLCSRSYPNAHAHVSLTPRRSMPRKALGSDRILYLFGPQRPSGVQGSCLGRARDPRVAGNC
jgi:hypothetical protein